MTQTNRSSTSSNSHRMIARLWSSILGWLAVLALSLCGPSALAGEQKQQPCPLQIVVETTNGPQCAYRVSMYLMQTTFNSLDVFDLPAAAVIKGFELAGFGFVADSYRDEAKGGYRTFAPASQGYSVSTTYRYVTSGGPTTERWEKLQNGSDRYVYTIKLGRDLFRGNVRKWFKGVVARIDVLDGYGVRVEDVEAIRADLRRIALDALNAEAKAIAEERERTRPRWQRPINWRYT